MAEAVISSIAEKTLDILGSQAIETVGKLRGLKHEVEALTDTVSILQPFLEHAEEQYPRVPRIRVWVEKLKDAFYEAQDVLEEFDIEAMRRELRGRNEMVREVRTFFSSSNQLAFKLKMSDKVRAVRERIQAIKADGDLGLNMRPLHSRVESERSNREETHSFIREDDIIGRHDDKEAVMNFLLSSDVKEPISILPIVGIGGLGKTALAKYVYQDGKFDLKMWVCVSTDFDVKKIVKKMLACAKNTEPSEDTMELLQRELREEIDGKKYLLVLDDVWDVKRETWERLETLLKGGARGSKILITTRLHSVGEIARAARSLSLEGLSESASLDLLLKMAGREMEEMQNSNMLAIGQEIVKKCAGVPLVVLTVGRLLSSKNTKLEWSQFKDNELPEVSQEEDVISVLRLSYDHLPSHLKQCFAFCSLFPKDYEIKKQTMVDLWVAEGFILPSNRSRHLEDIAHGYFMDLLWSNLFQDYQKDKETCKMHDLIHDLACSVAGTECWVAWDDKKSIHEGTRHVSHNLSSNLMGQLPILRLKAGALRTFLSVSRHRQVKKEPTSEADLRKLIQNFKKLRILGMHAMRVEKVPKSICKLKHLTYLDFSDNYELKRLPNSITRLQNFQTLNLNCCCALEELPKGIRKLVSLRNLDIDGCSKLRYVPPGLGQLSSLHRLTRFILPKDKALAKNYCGLGELNGLNDIRGSLCIENLGSVTDAAAESRAANLIGKHSLESLTLNWGSSDAEDAVIENSDEVLLGGLRPHSDLQGLTIHEYKGEKFPRWMVDNLVSSLPNLVELCLHERRRCRRLPQLGQLRRLKTLVIHGMTELECIESGHLFTSTTTSFPSLLRLQITGCEKLKTMPLAPHLEELRLNSVHPALINQIVVGLNKLKTLVIYGMSELECIESGHSFTSTTSFPSLLRLQITGCEKLKTMPLAPHLEELRLNSVHPALINQIVVGLNKLKTLHIGNIEFLECLPEEECLKSLTSLELLRIQDCPRLASLALGMRHLSSLVRLYIEGCDELDISKDESGNILDFHGGLQNLRSVAISNLPKLEFLPRWLLQASNLECLLIYVCHNWKELPEQIEALQSLQLLQITWCPLLTSLPEGVRRLASLTHLSIVNCQELEERCRRDGGEDWHKISHIPHISQLPYFPDFSVFE